MDKTWNLRLTRVRMIASLTVCAALGAASSAQAGVDPIAASPESLQLTSFELGHRVDETVVLTNQSRTPRRVRPLPMPPESAFSYADPSCSEPLAPHQSCRIRVSFRPEHWGETTGTLRFAVGDGPLSVYAVQLTGLAPRRDKDEVGSNERLGVGDGQPVEQ